MIHPKHYATRLFSFVCDPVTGILNKLNDEVTIANCMFLDGLSSFVGTV